MNKLTGIRAFEARWQSIKGTCRTSATDSKTLMQAMGRLVDNYATHEEILLELPSTLEDIFDSLVDAYLNGYWLNDEPGASTTQQRATEVAALTPAMLAANQLRQRRKLQPTETSEAATYIIQDPAACAHSAFSSAFA